MKLFIKIIIVSIFTFNLSIAETTNPTKKIDEQIKQLEKKIGTSLKALSGKSLNKKNTKKFISKYVFHLQDERGDGKVSYLFNDKEYVRYKNYEEISSGAWRFTNAGTLRVFNKDIKLSWKIKLGNENNINIKTKFDPIGKLYKFEYQLKESFLDELNSFKEQKESKKKRLEQEKLDAQKKADEEKKRLEQEKLDAKKKADEDKKRLEQENLDAQKKADEEKAKLEEEIAEQKRKLEEEKAKLEEEIAEQKRQLEEEKLFYDLEPKYKKKCQKKMFNDLYEVGTPEYKQCIINKGPKKLIEEQKLKEKLNEKKTAEVEKKRLEQKKLEAQKKAEEEKKLLEQEKLDAQKRAEEEKKRLEEEKLDAQKKAEISKYPLLIENIKFSLGEDVSDTKKLNYVFTVENRTNDKRLKFYACIEFLDKMNLNIFEEQGKNMSIGPADKKIYSDTKRVIENDNWDETTVLKIYLRQFGCVSSSDEFSNPLEFKIENGKIYNSKKEMILDNNISNKNSNSNSSTSSNLKTGESNFSEKYVYTHYDDGSCTGGKSVWGTGGRITKCITLIEYKNLCNLSKDITTSARSTAGVMYSGTTSTFITSGGTYGGFQKRWDDSKKRCAASFSVSGVLNGTSTSKTIYGRASTFVKLDNIIAINYLDSMR